MAESKQLVSNVFVPDENGAGVWYGPDYPQNEATAEVLKTIDNPAAFTPPAASPFDFSDRSTDEQLAAYGAGRPHDEHSSRQRASKPE